MKAVFVRARDLIRGELTRGSDPKKLAQATVLGAVIAVFPILGSTTVLCLGIGQVLRLNHAVMQAVNYLCYPLQLALLPVFLKAGTTVFGGDPMEFDFVRLKNEFFASIPDFLSKYGWIGLKGVGVWVGFAAVLVPIGVLWVERFYRRISKWSA